MSTSGKRVGEELCSQPESQHQDNVGHTDTKVYCASDEELEPPIAYTTTNVNVVFTASAVPSPQVAQTDHADWAAPIILVITKKT